MDHETAGDPVSGLKWTRRTTAKVADQLCALGIDVCPQTVARKAMGFVARKLAALPIRGGRPSGTSPNCASAGRPGHQRRYRNSWAQSRHQMGAAPTDQGPRLPLGLTIPYGIYDPRANAGTVFVGQTAEFAVDCIVAHRGLARPKRQIGRRRRQRWRLEVQPATRQPAWLARDRGPLSWNPIEHRLFCEVSKNWAGGAQATRPS